MLQMKEQGEKLKDQINEEEKSNLSKQGLRAIIVMEFQNIENRMAKMQEIFHTFSKYLEEINTQGLKLKIIYEEQIAEQLRQKNGKVGRWN